MEHALTQKPRLQRPRSQQPRSDARHNRAHILGVARATFAAQGLEVTMRELARRCELGVATLYRHFPTREDLVVAAFAEQVRECVATVAHAAEDPDAWRGITAVVEEVCTRQALDRGFNAALLGSASLKKVFAVERAQNVRALTRLVDRARREGAVRQDLTVEDLWLVLAATATPNPSVPDSGRALVEVRRLAALLLQGMRAQPTAVLIPLPVRQHLQQRPAS
ncbi:helix-turn-helix domain-containing protein [Actinoplanes sp. NBRC 103695]|uniref:TetR/AcrR family transcriptional regulator n=1 Tax=Actinoplanes sp. NBRC 103695 TaxID=3032202 RepID=UPI0033275EBD